jgi:hypothetical protein
MVGESCTAVVGREESDGSVGPTVSVSNVTGTLMMLTRGQAAAVLVVKAVALQPCSVRELVVVQDDAEQETHCNWSVVYFNNITCYIDAMNCSKVNKLTKSVTVRVEHPPVVVISVAEFCTSQPIRGAHVELATCVVDGPAENCVMQNEADFVSHCPSSGLGEYVGIPFVPTLQELLVSAELTMAVMLT